MKKIMISQSNYIPWKGFFDSINSVDEYVIYDDMQYTRRDWRNRNRIKTAQGAQWLTIPVEVKGKYHQTIAETMVSEKDWWKKHWRTIEVNYSRAQHFPEYRDVFEELYVRAAETSSLSEINERFITAICSILGIRTRITRSSDYRLVEGKTERLLDVCRQAEANEYYSGPAAKDYLDEKLFLAAGVRVCYFNYDGYPGYRQLFGEFEHGVSIIDLLFNEGSGAKRFMNSFNT